MAGWTGVGSGVIVNTRVEKTGAARWSPGARLSRVSCTTRTCAMPTAAVNTSSTRNGIVPTSLVVI
jgi:hypothetical protein